MQHGDAKQMLCLFVAFTLWSNQMFQFDRVFKKNQYQKIRNALKYLHSDCLLIFMV